MKRILCFTLLCILASSLKAIAQSDSEDEISTMFGRDTDIKGFASFDVKLSDFNEEKALFVGGHGGVILNRHIMIGIGGYGMTTRNDFHGLIPNKKLDLYSGYGGLVLGYVIAPKEVIHIAFPVLLGAGGVEVVDHELATTVDDNGATVERSAYFVVEPSVHLEVNVTKFFRLAIGGGYRLIQGTSLNNNKVNDDDLTSWTAEISFKFGKF